MASSTIDTPVGRVTVVTGQAGLRSVGWRAASTSDEGDASTSPVVQQLREYFAGTRRTFDLTVDLDRLEPRTRAVLETLRSVPYGSTITYGELAERSGTGLPARAIGSVMASNPVPLVIPCHRVVASDGLGGFSGGERGRELPTKLWLLEHEGAFPPTLL